MLNKTTRISIRSNLLCSDVGGEVVMLDVEKGHYFSLNKTGSAIWEALREPKTIADLCGFLGERYNAPPETIERDVLDLLTALLDKDLLQIHS